MKKVSIGLTLIVFSFGILLLNSCGKDYDKESLIPGPQGAQGNQGAQGSAGADGLNGVNGLNGTDGHNSLITTSRFTSDPSLCAAGSGILVKSGLDSNTNNTLDASEVNSAVVVCDGVKGDQGNQGVQGVTGTPGTPAPQYAILKFITPCPSITTSYREVIIKLVNGSFLSSFSENGSALTVRLTLIPNGSYVDTDGSNCNFTVNGSTLTDQYGNVF